VLLQATEYTLFRLLDAVLSRLPFGAARRIGSVLGLIAMEVFRFRRTITLDNLTHAFPDLPQSQILRIARGAYRNYGTAIMELFWSGRATVDELKDKVHFRNPSVAFDALARGKGLILLSAHFGSWEFILNGVRVRFPQRFFAVAQRQSNERIANYIDARRQRFDNKILYMGPNVREIVQALRDKEIIILLGDQSASKEATYVRFFGRAAATHRGAAAFSLKSGAPLVLTLLVRQPDGRYEVQFEEVNQDGLEGSSEEKIVELTARHAALLEKYIRLYPDHWLWMHKRWKHTRYFEEHRQDGAVSTSQDLRLHS
jgi:Kdo2-lipid IVA lauroyltransferase/acyltransferase